MSKTDKPSFVAAVASQHGRRLRRFLSQRLQNRADAPDLAQEVYLRLLRVGQHEEIRSPEAYLLTIASHLLYEHSMKQAAVPPIVDIEDLVSELHTLPEEDPASHFEVQQRLRVVERALRKLSPKARAVLLMHRRDGLSLDEIAERLGISRSMAKKYLAQTLAKCRKHLAIVERE